MNEGRPLNGENHNHFPLVRKPSSAVEKAAPGAKRILSGMVADALALAKLLFTVLMHDDEISDLVEACIKLALNGKYTLRVIRFRRATELLKLAHEQSFDLIFFYVFNVQWDTGAGGFSTHEAAVLGQIKSQYGKPIIATQGLDLRKEFEGTGVTFIDAPFTNEQLRDFLKLQFPAQFTDEVALAKNKEREKLRVVVLDDEEAPRRTCMMMLESCWQHGLEILEFQDAADAWQELSRTDPDLFITDIQHIGISCKEMLARLAKRKVKYPIMVISAVLGVYEDSGKPIWVQDVKRDWKPNLKVIFLSKPYTLKAFQIALETALKIPRDAPTQNEIISLKSRPLNRRGKLLVLDDEDGPRQSLRVIFENEYDLFMAEDGLTAIELAKQNDIDVAVLDIRMAVMSGLEVLERLKILKPDIEVIMMSGYGTNDCIRESFRLGASDYINKPFDISTIRAAVSKAMQHCTLRKRNTPKLSIAVCGHCDESFCEWLGAIFHELLSKKYTVKIEPFIFADELFEAAQGKPFDLFIVFLNPRLPRKVDAHELVATLKRQFQKPILILTNEIIYGLDSAAGFKQAGADAFFSFMPPFPPAGFKEALEKCVSKNQQT